MVSTETIPAQASGAFDKRQVLGHLRHYLPSQAPLKDFVHHNTLHAFQHLPFHEALALAADLFGYQTYLSLSEYRERFAAGHIRAEALRRAIAERHGAAAVEGIWEKCLHTATEVAAPSRIGQVRQHWKRAYKINLDKMVHPILFRLLGSYLDQGIATWKYPSRQPGLLASLREMEGQPFVSLFRKKGRARRMLLDGSADLERLLALIVGDARYYEAYLFDQQFAHPGWSGMLSVLEVQPGSLLDARPLSLEEGIVLELLLELDALDGRLGEWSPLATALAGPPPALFASLPPSEGAELKAIWQEAMEWSYYDQVLQGLQRQPGRAKTNGPAFQAIFCIDDRECSLRRHIERLAPDGQTYGTAGFFNFPFYFQPEHSKFHTKVCPAPMAARHLIKEREASLRHEKDAHFSRHPQGLLNGWAIAQTMGFWSAIKMARSIFWPSETPVMVSSFRHMDPQGKLHMEKHEGQDSGTDLQEGFSVAEMADRLEALLRSIGMTGPFAPLVYWVGHGASSVNNTHYAGYDCGACSGRAGSANARVVAHAGNHPKVRALLRERGIDIPDTTHFVAALHDTTRDEMAYYDEAMISADQWAAHRAQVALFDEALHYNAKERSRRFFLMDSKADAARVHEQVKLRALSLFEPRPEWNHATNALCIVGRRETNRHLFLDRRSFLNSYDCTSDPEGQYLRGILDAVAPVCGGINLEYYFSRVDNERLGAGSKLPHNVMGLIGVANGMDGDLRTGLPLQMVNIHEPLRLLVIVEHEPDVVLRSIAANAATFEWFAGHWVHLAVLSPSSGQLYRFDGQAMRPHQPLGQDLPCYDDMERLWESAEDNLPVILIQNASQP